MRWVGKYEQRSAKLHRLLALNVGFRIAHYDVTALIGQGGELRGHLGASASYPGNGT